MLNTGKREIFTPFYITGSFTPFDPIDSAWIQNRAVIEKLEDLWYGEIFTTDKMSLAKMVEAEITLNIYNVIL